MNIQPPPDTPTLVIDLDIMERNLKAMQALADRSGKALRPHAKSHKIPEIARQQIEMGARGICVQKVAEAEVFAGFGIKDIFISNEILGKQKIRRIFDLMKKKNNNCNVSLAVDSTPGIRELDEVAKDYDSEIDILVDVDVGMRRCGVDPNDEQTMDSIAQELGRSRRVNFKGLMGYDGNTASIADPNKRREAVLLARDLLLRAETFFRNKGFQAKVISAAGSHSAHLWSAVDGVSELQPGSYVFNDMLMVSLGLAKMEDIAVYVLSRVISRSKDRAVIDVGYKAAAIVDGNYPTLREEDDIQERFSIKAMNEEHTILTSSHGDGLPMLEDLVVLFPFEIPATIDLWDDVICVRKKDKIVETFKVAARGKRT